MKQVRRKFVLYAMLAVFVLLLTILTIINGTNFTMAASDADAVTAMLAENKGKFDEAPEGFTPNTAPPAGTDFPKDGAFPAQPFFRNGLGPMGPESPETGFSIRYFTVCFEKKSGETSVTAYQIAAVTEEEAIRWAEALKTEGKKDVTGWTRGTYRYRCYTRGDSVYVTVIDQGRELTPSYRILVISLIGMALGLLISFLFLSLISKRLFRPLEEADRKQRQFILEAEKEFKIPLTVIQADTELIERENGPSDYTTSIHRQVNRMADLTKDLGNLAIFNQNDAVTACLLRDVFSKSVSGAEESLRAAGITVTEQYQEGLSLQANPELLRRIADELLENVSRFALSEAVIRTEKKEGRIIVTLENDCSLPDGSYDNVFDRFIRLPNAEGTAGAGLGLSFVKDAVYQIGGRASAKVEGGRFILKLYL